MRNETTSKTVASKASELLRRHQDFLVAIVGIESELAYLKAEIRGQSKLIKSVAGSALTQRVRPGK